MRAKLVLSFLLVILSIVAVNAIFYYVVHEEFQRLWLSAAVGIAVGMSLGFFISRSITAGISDLAAVTREIAAGDLTKEVRPAATANWSRSPRRSRPCSGSCAWS